MRKSAFGIVLCLLTISVQAQSYVDLGLPSGTLWKSQNEENNFCTYQQAIALFGDSLPSADQWNELSICRWEWTGNGYKIIGTNGQFIVLPTEGYRIDDGSIIGVKLYGHYWSSTIDNKYGDLGNAFSFYFDQNEMYVDSNSRKWGLSIRCVKHP